jgi:hypothetical protein
LGVAGRHIKIRRCEPVGKKSLDEIEIRNVENESESRTNNVRRRRRRSNEIEDEERPGIG